MKQRMWTILAVLVLPVLLLCGCSKEETPAGTPYALYFVEQNGAGTGDSVFDSETVYLEQQEGETEDEFVARLLQELLNGPKDTVNHRSMIPQGTQLTSVRIRNGRAVVDFSSAYDSLSGVTLSLADYAVTLTLSQLPQVHSVQIQVRGHDMSFRQRQVLTTDDIVGAQSDVVDTIQLTLYVPVEDHLRPTSRNISLYEGDTEVRAVLRELNQLWEELPVQAVWRDEELCYVDLTEQPPENMDGYRVRLLLEAVERSFCSLDAVEQVRFLVNGELAAVWGRVTLSSQVEN